MSLTVLILIPAICFIGGFFSTLGTMIYFSLPETFLALMLGCVLLWFCWIPPSAAARTLAARAPYSFFWVGILHTFLSTISGAGVLFQSVMGILGTVIGKLCLDILPDRYFRLLIRIVVTLFALRLFWQAATNLLS